jgi:hypothetical protein
MRTSHLFTTLLVLGGCLTPEEKIQPIPGRDDLAVAIFHSHISDGLSDEMVVTAPDGLESVLMEVRGDKGLYYLAKFQTPSGDLIEGGRYTTRFAREVPGLVDWLYPNTPTLAMEPGEYRLLLRGETPDGGKLNEDVEVRFYTKKKQDFDTCGIHLDFLVDKQAIDSADFEAAVDRSVVWVNNLYAPMGIRVLDYQITQITLPHPNVDPTMIVSVTKDVDNVLAQARATGSVRADAVHVIVVRAIGGSEPAGYSMGLPGPFDVDRSNAAVLVSTDAYTSGGFLDVDGLSSTIAHEVGHYLGLYHTSESTGTQHDPLPDTPECTGAVCTPEFDNNIMTAGGGANRMSVTDGQAFVMRQHPLCVPTVFDQNPTTCETPCSSPQTCSIIGGTAECREACDPDAPMCTAGTCKPDDTGTFVCAP